MALKGINAYKKGSLKQDVSNADPHRLTLMLMQGALDRIAYARGAIERKEFEAKSEFLSRTIAILMNLRDTLDLDIGGEFAQNMYSLYDYMIEQINTAHVSNNIEILNEVIGLLLPIKDAWLQIPQQAKEEAYESKKQRSQAV